MKQTFRQQHSPKSISPRGCHSDIASQSVSQIDVLNKYRFGQERNQK